MKRVANEGCEETWPPDTAAWSEPSAGVGLKLPANIGGRPSSYCEEIAAEIVDSLFNGEFLRAILRKPGMPSRQTINNWVDRYPEFADRLARARQVATGDRVDELLHIDRPRSDDLVFDDEGRPALNPDCVKLRKLVSDNVKWLASRFLSDQYGDHLSKGLPPAGPRRNGDDAKVIDADPLADAIAAYKGKYETRQT